MVLIPLLLGSAAARIHARLERAEPGINATVAAAPARLQLWFNQPVNPRLTQATILTADSVTVASVTFARTPDSLSVAGPIGATLRPGGYRVQWRTMSQDGHPIRGEYRFQYTP